MTAPAVQAANGQAPGHRPPPSNLEAEMALLGAMLADGRAYDRVSDFLLPEHFADPRHGRIYAAIGKLIGAGRIADPVTLKNALEADGSLDGLGGSRYLSRLLDAVVSVHSAGDYGRTIHDRWKRREIIYLSEEVAEAARRVEIDASADQVIELAESRLHGLTQGLAPGGAARPLGSVVRRVLDDADEAMKSGRRMKGVLTGIAPLDNRLRGLRGGQLIVLAGATSSGKSALATNIAYNAAQPRLDQGATQPSPGHRVAFFSLEMAAEELATNMMTRETGLASNDIDSGNIEIADFYRLAAAGEKMDRLPLYIDDSATNYVSTIRSKCRREKPALVVIDYLQLMPAAAPDAVFWNDVSRIEQITRGLKLLAKDLNVPVIALSQFSRQTATRENHRPLLSDLRSSGSIENDADIVLLIYREEYWLERNKPDPGKDKEMVEWESRLQACRNKTEIIIAKGRRLGIGSVNLYYDAARCRFDSWPPPADSAGDAFAYQEKLAI